MFAGNYAPQGWALCDGSQLAINANAALFSILGVQYGGNGTSTFGLPDLRGRVPLGMGNAPGLTPRNVGNVLGEEAVTLLTSQIPAHVHPMGAATVNVTPGSGGGTAELYAYAGNADTEVATAGSALASVNSGGRGASVYPTFSASGAPDTKLNAATIQNVQAALPQVTVALPNTTGISGASLPHDNMPPALCINFIICLSGIYPSRQ